MNGTDVQSTLREMWETRPARPRHDRKIAGVAAAIARRYDIDPVLVRVGFAVTAFYGIGALLSIAGWILLPDDRADDPDGRAGQGARHRPHPVLLVGLVVATVAGLGIFFGRDGGALLPLLAAVVLLFLLHRSRGDRGPVGPGPGLADQPTVTQPTVTQPTVTQPADSPTAPLGGDPPRTNPPAWDPLGAAPFAWDLPEPAAASSPAPEPHRRSAVTPVTLAVALLAGGVLGFLMLLGHGLTSVPVLFGIVLAILGAGLVVGAFVGGGRWLIPVALLLCVLTWVSASTPFNWARGEARLGGLRGGVGETVAVPTVAELAPRYERAAGSVRLDLSRLDLTQPPGLTVPPAEPVRTSASVGLGSIEVVVPPNADLTLHGSAGLGDVAFGQRRQGGPGAELTVVDDLGADGVRSGRPLELDLTVGTGDVQVRRA